MTPAEFKAIWAKASAKESASYQSHFDGICRMLGVPSPMEADPKGESFCYQKHVTKDGELFGTQDATGETASTERGYVDVWKKGCFAWEYKGKGKNLDEAYKQLLRYRESLLNPPLLVVCDFDRFIIRTNFNGTVQETHEFTNAQIDRPEVLRILRALFTEPDRLKPQRTTAQVTEELAAKIADVAKSLQKREASELVNAKNRAEANFAKGKNLRIGRFLNRLVFCFFAEDTGLLPKKLFTELLKANLVNPRDLAETMENLFSTMAKGGTFGKDRIRHFNGHLFEDSTVFELTEEELRTLAEAGEAEWQFIQPSIMGTLFERALDERQRSQLGAHYTSEEDIRTLVEPVLMAPFRREWDTVKAGIEAIGSTAKAKSKARESLAAFQKKLATVTVMDPACGSGNFLYVALRLLLDLEKEVITRGVGFGLSLKPQVSIQQLKAIEINPYAFELSQVSVQIGWLQWRQENGFDNDRTPVLQTLAGFENKDALLNETFRKRPKNLRAAQAEEHLRQDEMFKVYTERAWPACDVIVGNPPFIGNKRLRTELGDAYAKSIFEVYGNRLPGTSDLCCYWFEKAREQIERGECKRAGLLATTGSKQIGSRQAFERIITSGHIFFAVSDRDWFDAGTAIRICMVGFSQKESSVSSPILDGKPVKRINANLTSGNDLTSKKYLRENQELCFMGTTKVGDFDLQADLALEMLKNVNPNGKPSCDVLRPFKNGRDLVRCDSGRWIVDFGVGTKQVDASLYEGAFEYVVKHVKPNRKKNNDIWRREHWWLLGRTLSTFREATRNLPRFIATARVAKHRIFVWLESVVLPDSKVIAFAIDDDFRFGTLHSRIHEVWSLATCGWHGKGNTATYNPTECFETFPFPRPNLNQSTKISEAARNLNELRELWLNPPEWTQERVLEFPGTKGGPWHRFIDPATVDPKTKVGTVRYPRLEPRNPEFAAKLKKRTLTALYNERPAWLDLAHKRLDSAVAEAYGWPADLTDDQILERLLALNLERASEEEKPKRAMPLRVSRAKQADELI